MSFYMVILSIRLELYQLNMNRWVLNEPFLLLPALVPFVSNCCSFRHLFIICMLWVNNDPPQLELNEWLCLPTALLRNRTQRSASCSNNQKHVNPEECFHANSALQHFRFLSFPCNPGDEGQTSRLELAVSLNCTETQAITQQLSSVRLGFHVMLPLQRFRGSTQLWFAYTQQTRLLRLYLHSTMFSIENNSIKVLERLRPAVTKLLPFA